MQQGYIHKVKYYECDRMGITHHSNYVRFMEEARIDLLDRLGCGFERMEADGLVSPVMAIDLHYRKPTTFQDEIEVEIGLQEMSALKFRFGYTMRVKGEVVCTASSLHCFLRDGKPVSFEKSYPELCRKLREGASGNDGQ